MKNQFKTIVTGIVTVLAFSWGCQKENPVKSKLPLITTELEDPCNIDFSLACETNIPHYASVQDFEDMYACLETEFEAYNDAYENQYTTLSDDDYDDQVESDLFNEEQTLDDWETTKGFVSLRTRLNQDEVVWLANNMAGADPFDHALCDIIMMTMINADGDVKIGSELIHFDPDGSRIIVANGDCEEFANAKQSPEYVSERVQRIPWSGPETCESHEFNQNLVVYANGNKQYQWRVDFDSYIAQSRAKSVIRNFRNKNGNWKKFAARSYVYIAGVMWNNECLESSALSYDSKSKRRKRLSVRTWAFTYGKIQTGEILGTFKLFEPNITLYEDIDW